MKSCVMLMYFELNRDNGSVGLIVAGLIGGTYRHV